MAPAVSCTDEGVLFGGGGGVGRWGAAIGGVIDVCHCRGWNQIISGGADWNPRVRGGVVRQSRGAGRVHAVVRRPGGDTLGSPVLGGLATGLHSLRHADPVVRVYAMRVAGEDDRAEGSGYVLLV